jgi:hypothetical protein
MSLDGKDNKMKKHVLLHLDDIPDCTMEFIGIVIKGFIYGVSFAAGWCVALKLISLIL